MLHRVSDATMDSFGQLFMPDEADEPILARPVRGALTEWLTEIWAKEALAAVGIKPRMRAIFDGPPGVGKTTLAHHLAARLGLPMLAVRPEKLLSVWVHASGANMGELFDLVEAGLDGTPVLLFLDEFDAIAGERMAAMHGADQRHNEEVNVLLQRIEQHDGFLIAATNHGEQIDRAVWRRFDLHLTLELPGLDERRRILARYLAPFGMPRAALDGLAEALDTASPALMRQLCENLKRQIVVGPLLGSDMRLGPVIDRLIAACHPHPDLGKPRLWSHGAADKCVAAIPWPLPLAADVVALDLKRTPQGPPADADNVVSLGRRAP